MTNKTEITIEGDSIIYNGVKYEKVKVVPSEQPFKLKYMFADVLEDELMGYDDIRDALNEIDEISQKILERMEQYIPDYSDWVDAIKEHPKETFTCGEEKFFQDGWNAYCKKMWDMINE